MSYLQKWVAGVLATLLVSWILWASSAIIQASTLAIASDKSAIAIDQRLNRIEDKIDTLMFNQPPRDWSKPEPLRRPR